MAAYYQSGVCNNTNDLLAIADAFIVGSLGWTQLQHQLEYIGGVVSDSTARNTYYYTVNGGYYFMAGGIEGVSVDYRTYIKGGVINGHTPTPLEADPIFIYAFDDQVGYQYTATANDFAGPYVKYHMFGGQEGTEGNYFYCVVEKTAGLFAHFGMGDLDRIGDTIGRFVVCLNWSYSAFYWRNVDSAYHQRLFDGHSSLNSGERGHLAFHQLTPDIGDPGYDPAVPENYIFGYDNSHVFGGVGGSLNLYFGEDSPNAFNGRTMLMPNYIHVDDRGSPSWQRIVGIAPAFRFLKMDNLQPEDIIDTDWMVFPLKTKNAATGPTSYNYAIAYRWQDTQ